MNGFPNARWKHGHARKNGLRSATYNTWHGMIQRCYSKKNPYYHNYGGRGIRVYPAWLKFSSFLADVGVRPVGMTLDRPDNDADYGPTNWRWATKETQSGNRRDAVLVEYLGKKMCLTHLARKFSIHPMTLRYRILNLGWSVGDAIKIKRDIWASRRRNNGSELLCSKS